MEYTKRSVNTMNNGMMPEKAILCGSEVEERKEDGSDRTNQMRKCK
jgi:hypothetical protein